MFFFYIFITVWYSIYCILNASIAQWQSTCVVNQGARVQSSGDLTVVNLLLIIPSEHNPAIKLKIRRRYSKILTSVYILKGVGYAAGLLCRSLFEKRPRFPCVGSGRLNTAKCQFRSRFWSAGSGPVLSAGSGPVFDLPELIEGLICRSLFEKRPRFPCVRSGRLNTGRNRHIH